MPSQHKPSFDPATLIERKDFPKILPPYSEDESENLWSDPDYPFVENAYIVFRNPNTRTAGTRDWIFGRILQNMNSEWVQMHVATTARDDITPMLKGEDHMIYTRAREGLFDAISELDGLAGFVPRTHMFRKSDINHIVSLVGPEAIDKWYDVCVAFKKRMADQARGTHSSDSVTE